MTPSLARRLLKAIRLATRYCGSIKGIATKSIEVLRAEGLSGLRLRLRILLDQSSIASDTATFHRPVFARATHIDRSSIPRTQSVDIIVCVHNAPDDTRHCLDSVVQHTAPPYRLIIVDDGSADLTAAYLGHLAAELGVLLIRNPDAIGYTRAANIGLRASSAEFVVLLNSDTIVSPTWLDRMVACALSDDKIGVVGPLSNAASWQSVPLVTGTNGDWADNPLPPDWTVAKMATEVAHIAPYVCPRVGFINGFCFMIRRKAIESVGVFDESTFARGYGEENDYCLRAAALGWQLAIAEDAYVFHAQSRSYSHERRQELSSLAHEALARKHGELRIIEQVGWTKNHPVLEYMRQRCAKITEESELQERMRNRFSGKRVLFILPITTAGGGGNVVICEVGAMRRAGIDAQIANLEFNRDLFERHHPNLDFPLVYFHSPTELTSLGASFDAVVATHYATVEWLKPLSRSGLPTTTAYYVQDFEPNFFPSNSREYRRARASYTEIPLMRLFCKTRWTRDTVSQKTGIYPYLIGPSYDVDNFFPDPGVPNTEFPVTLIAMIRPRTLWRAPEMTMRVLGRIKRHFGDAVIINTFGARSDDPGYLATSWDFQHTCMGELSSPEVADALRQSDIFLDLSSFQAMGLTAMEAMASGVAVVGPIKGGLSEIIEDGRSGLLVDTRDEGACFKAACRLIADAPLRHRLRNHALTVTRWTPARSASLMMDAIFGHTSQNEIKTVCRNRFI